MELSQHFSTFRQLMNAGKLIISQSGLRFAFWKFSINDAAGCAKVQEFMKIVIKGLNERSYVERYSWFCPNIEEDAASSSSIFNYKTGELTTLGKIYAQIGNPLGYNAKTYGVSSYISTNTSPAACAISHANNII